MSGYISYLQNSKGHDLESAVYGGAFVQLLLLVKSVRGYVLVPMIFSEPNVDHVTNIG